MPAEFSCVITAMKEKFIGQVLLIEVECNLSHWKYEDYQNLISAPSSAVIVAKSGEKVIGFLTARFTPANSKDGYMFELGEAEIFNIGVLNSFQGQGVGSKLLSEFVLKAKETNVGTIWLEVRESNLPAVEFYKSGGFIKSGIRINYYNQPRENAVIMKLSF